MAEKLYLKIPLSSFPILGAVAPSLDFCLPGLISIFPTALLPWAGFLPSLSMPYSIYSPKLAAPLLFLFSTEWGFLLQATRSSTSLHSSLGHSTCCCRPGPSRPSLCSPSLPPICLSMVLPPGGASHQTRAALAPCCLHPEPSSPHWLLPCSTEWSYAPGFFPTVRLSPPALAALLPSSPLKGAKLQAPTASTTRHRHLLPSAAPQLAPATSSRRRPSSPRIPSSFGHLLLPDPAAIFP